MTIYGMYAQNGNRAGFWVQHRGWDNTCALVLSVGGADMGPLPGRAPLHDSAEVVVRRHDVRSGRLLETTFTLTDPNDKNFAYIAEPSWSRGKSPGGPTSSPSHHPRAQAEARRRQDDQAAIRRLRVADAGTAAPSS